MIHLIKGMVKNEAAYICKHRQWVLATVLEQCLLAGGNECRFQRAAQAQYKIELTLTLLSHFCCAILLRKQQEAVDAKEVRHCKTDCAPSTDTSLVEIPARLEMS